MMTGNTLSSLPDDEDVAGSRWEMPCLCSIVHGKLASRKELQEPHPACLRTLNRRLASQILHEDWDGAVQTVFALQRAVLYVGMVLAEHALAQRRQRRQIDTRMVG